eukprot:m.22989 g.22989  ORF g.22989 m.22989 type:complete len:52 (+) comp12857_c0_seq1:178-333(+)
MHTLPIRTAFTWHNLQKAAADYAHNLRLPPQSHKNTSPMIALFPLNHLTCS